MPSLSISPCCYHGYCVMADSTLSLVAKLLARYEGTHKFHNFTAGKKFDDHSTNRTVTSFKVMILCLFL